MPPNLTRSKWNLCLLSVQSQALAGEWEAGLGPLPPASQGGLSKMLQIPDGPQPRAFSPENFSTQHSAPYPSGQGSAVDSLMSLRLEDSTLCM